jgi:hypothetical protein
MVDSSNVVVHLTILCGNGRAELIKKIIYKKIRVECFVL